MDGSTGVWKESGPYRQRVSARAGMCTAGGGRRWGDQKKTWLLTSQSWERKYISHTHTHTHTHTQHARAQAQYWTNSIRCRFSSVSVPGNHLEACGNRSGQARSLEFLPQVWCRWARALPGGPLSGSRAVRVSIWKCSRSKYEQAHLEKAGTLTGCLCGTMSHLNMLAKGRKTSAQAD